HADLRNRRIGELHPYRLSGDALGDARTRHSRDRTRPGASSVPRHTTSDGIRLRRTLAHPFHGGGIEMARITLDHIRHAYGSRPSSEKDYALKEVHHEWKDGGAYALLGPSGCGKTTLLNIISGLLTPSEGRIYFDGTDVTDLSTENRNIAQVFQFPVIYDTMTVYDNLAFPLRNRKVPEPEVDRRVRETLEMIDLGGWADRKARGLTADQ